jgi:hypothetical protein
MATSKTGLVVPDIGAPPNVPSDMLSLANQLDNVIVPAFATTAARDAAVTAGATFGMCFVAGVPYRLRAGVWVQLTDATDVAAIPKALNYAAPALPTVNIGSGGGTLGIGSGCPITAQPYQRLVRISLDVVLATATTFCSFTLLWNGGSIGNGTRGVTPYQGIHLEAFVALAANASGTASATISCGVAAGLYGAPLGQLIAQTWPM